MSLSAEQVRFIQDHCKREFPNLTFSDALKVLQERVAFRKRLLEEMTHQELSPEPT